MHDLSSDADLVGWVERVSGNTGADVQDIAEALEVTAEEVRARCDDLVTRGLLVVNPARPTTYLVKEESTDED